MRQDQRGWDQGDAKPQGEENLQRWWARTGPKDLAVNDHQLNCPRKLPSAGAGGLHKLCRAEPWAAAGFAGAAAPPAHPSLCKHLLWPQKAILLVLKDQKFLNPTQVISRISKNRQPCGLSPPCFLLDLGMPVGMQLRWVHRRADPNNVFGLQSLILQEERDMHLHCRWASSGGRSGPGQAVTLQVCVRMCVWACVCDYTGHRALSSPDVRELTAHTLQGLGLAWGGLQAQLSLDHWRLPYLYLYVFLCVQRLCALGCSALAAHSYLSAFLPSLVIPLRQGKFPLGLIFWMTMFCMWWRGWAETMDNNFKKKKKFFLKSEASNLQILKHFSHQNLHQAPACPERSRTWPALTETNLLEVKWPFGLTRGSGRCCLPPPAAALSHQCSVKTLWLFKTPAQHQSAGAPAGARGQGGPCSSAARCGAPWPHSPPPGTQWCSGPARPTAKETWQERVVQFRTL